MKNDLFMRNKIAGWDPKSLFLPAKLYHDNSEQLKQLENFNNTSIQFPAGKTIISLFEEQVTKTPDNTAVIFEDQHLTYQQLNSRSNQLAHYLQSKGVVQETLVPICIERGPGMLIGIIGILKAGGAYIPVDPEYPLDRIQYMLSDSQATIAVSSITCRSKLLSYENLEIVDINDPLINNKTTENVQVKILPGQLAYIIYTSGSTGKPKGVMIEHRNTYSFICWCRHEFQQSYFEVVYACTSICFDLSVFEMFYPLSIGKPVRIVANGMHISKYISKDSFVLINTVPSVIDRLLRDGTDLSNVSIINLAGEPVPWYVKQHLDTDKTEVRNLYGPTETTTYSTVYRIHKSEPVLIGRPIANTSIYILNDDKHLAPIGVPGEICIGGIGVARGYLNKEKLTFQKFVENPFDKRQTSRMYKTGDLGKWLPDGNIEYLGRLDDQVKIRGYRIEPGEIETVLVQSKLFEKVVILTKEDKEGNKKLVGYVVPVKDFNKEVTLSYLRTRLPEYMVPALWVVLKTLPLTPNGKIDKQALHDPNNSELLTSNYVAPGNETEWKLAEIWQNVLSVERIGINDHFFDLGGDSLVAMRAVSLMSKDLGMEIIINDLLFHPTIAELAQHIAVRKPALLSKSLEKTKSIVAVQKEGNEIPFFAIPGFFQFRYLALYMGKNRPFYGFEPSHHKDIENVALHYIQEMKAIQPEGPYLLGGFCDMGRIAFEMASILMAQGESVPVIVLMESYAPEAIISRLSPQFLYKKSHAVLSSFKEMNALEKASSIPKGLQKIYHYLFQKEKFLNDGNLIDNDRLYVDDALPYTIKTFPGKVVLFKARKPLLNYSDDPQMGWRKYVTGPIETYIVEGDHQNIFRDPGVKMFAEKLREVLQVASVAVE